MLNTLPPSTIEEHFIGLEEVTARKLNSRLFRISLGDCEFDCYLDILEGSDRLFIMLHGAISREKHRPPILGRWNWKEKVGGSILSISDPTLLLSDQVHIGWYLGDEKRNPIPSIVSIAEKVASDLDVTPVFYGSSAGGFAAICAACESGGVAVAINPQLDLVTYRKGLVSVSALFGCSPQEAKGRHPSRWTGIGAFRRAIERDLSPSIIIAQNKTDHHHLAYHLTPFCKEFGIDLHKGSSHVQTYLFALAGGHTIKETPEVIRGIRKRLDTIISLRRSPFKPIELEADPVPAGDAFLNTDDFLMHDDIADHNAGDLASEVMEAAPAKLSVSPGENNLTFELRNGDSLKKAFVAVVEFWSDSGALIPAPYDGFSFSKKTGSYRYLPGGSQSSPTLTSLRFETPTSAVSLSVTVKRWECESAPEVRFEIAKANTERSNSKKAAVAPADRPLTQLEAIEGVIRFTVRNGGPERKAYIAAVKFWDAKRRLLSAPYAGLSFSPRTGAFAYLSGGSTAKPSVTTASYTAPLGATFITVDIHQWAHKEEPEVDFTIYRNGDFIEPDTVETLFRGNAPSEENVQTVSLGDEQGRSALVTADEQVKRFALFGNGNNLTFAISNGGDLPKAFIVKFEFFDGEGGTIRPPHDGFFQSRRHGSYRYVTGGTPGFPARTEIIFTSPPGAEAAEIKILPWHCKVAPELAIEPQIVEMVPAAPLPEALSVDVDGLRTKLLSELALPGKPAAFKPVDRRLCYVLHNSFPHATGGYATRAHGLAKALQAEGDEVIAVTRPGFPLDTMKMAAEDANHSTIDGIRYHRMPGPWRKGKHLYAYMLDCIDEYEAIFRDLRPRAVVAASFYYSAMPAMIAARRLGLPFVYEVRGLAELTKLSRDSTYSDTEEFNETVAMDTATCMAADRVFTLTSGMGSILKERGVPAEKITIIPNAVNTEVFSAADRDEDLAMTYGIPSNVPVIGYVGGIVDYEGLDDLVTACGELKQRGLEFRLLIVGSDSSSTAGGLGPLAKDLKRSAADQGLSDWLVMPGRVSHDEARRHYSLIDIAPLPRKAWPVCETVSPMKPLEALSMKKSVVVSSVAALAEMIDHEHTGLVFEKANIGALTDALERLIKDSELRMNLGAAGRDFVVNQRSWSHSAKLGLSVIDSLV
nr:glycosyltransferase family 4 protein [uncultured Shinella sp.]